jgi:hypothetical protein
MIVGEVKLPHFLSEYLTCGSTQNFIVYAKVIGRELAIVRRLESLNILGYLQKGWTEVVINSIIS